MELITLDSSFQPKDLLENYQSLIWTERYSKAGDFELKSNDISAVVQALPLDSCVSLRESTVPMVVETQKIEKDANSTPIITVTGRSFEASAIERRASVRDAPPAARTAWVMGADRPSDAAYKMLRIVLGDTNRYDSNGAFILSAIPPAVSANDAIPEIDLVVPQDITMVGQFNYEIPPGNLYETLIGLIEINHHGVKSVRPLDDSTKVGIEIYNGADLTNTVVFDARFDQFDSSTYLLSQQASTNVAYVYGSGGSDKVLKTAAAEPSGLDRRVLLLDQSSDTTANTSEIRKTRGLIELYKHNSTALFDGEVSAQVATGYNRDYFLGDILKLVGEYGLSQNVRVAEFIRSSDAQGPKAYPAFEAAD